MSAFNSNQWAVTVTANTLRTIDPSRFSTVKKYVNKATDWLIESKFIKALPDQEIDEVIEYMTEHSPTYVQHAYSAHLRGSVTSDAKAEAVRANGAKGGRPKSISSGTSKTHNKRTARPSGTNKAKSRTATAS